MSREHSMVVRRVLDEGKPCPVRGLASIYAHTFENRTLVGAGGTSRGFIEFCTKCGYTVEVRL